jgi:hypothetical protein
MITSVYKCIHNVNKKYDASSLKDKVLMIAKSLGIVGTIAVITGILLYS